MSRAQRVHAGTPAGRQGRLSAQGAQARRTGSAETVGRPDPRNNSRVLVAGSAAPRHSLSLGAAFHAFGGCVGTRAGRWP